MVNYIKSSAGLLAVLYVLLLSGCLKKELSDYDPNAVAELNLSANLADKYILNIDEHLKLKAELGKEGLNPSDYSFQWYYYLDEPNTVATPIMLSSTAELDLLGDMATGNYKLFVEVTDKRTDVRYFKEMRLNVRRRTSEGWLLLTYKNNLTNMSIISSEGNIYKDFLEPNTEVPLVGKPLELLVMNDWDGKVQPITIRTDQPQIYFLDYNSFKVERTANDAFVAGSAAKFDFFGSDMWYGMYYLRDTEGNIYNTGRGMGENDNFPEGFDDPMLGNYVLAPFLVPSSDSYPIQAMFYDTQSKKFVYQPSYENELKPFQSAGTGAGFDMSDVKDNILYAGLGASGSSYAIGELNGQLSIYEMKLDKGLTTYPAVSKKAFTVPNGQKPTFFACSGKAPLLYFIAGNELYLFKTLENKIYSLYTFPANEKVATLKMFKETIMQTQKDNPAMENRLCIAANSADEGIFYTFDLSPTGSLKEGTYVSRIAGFAPIMDIAYKELK